MRLQHFADFSAIFQERFMKPLWERYPQRERDTWDSLGLFLEGYAFERQGRRPDYGPAAVDAIVQAKSTGEGLETKGISQAVWNGFKQYLGTKLNEANNPLCPKDTVYTRRHKDRHTGEETKTKRTTKNESVIEVLCGMSASASPPNIIVYAKAGLTNDQLKSVHDKIMDINGIGSKIASLFLRDVATFYNVFPPNKDRHLLQPIDIWVRRIVKELAGPDGPVTEPNKQDPKVDEEARKWIVNQSARASVNPEEVNQGMWYFATQIAGSYHRLKNSIHDLECAERLFAQHKQSLNGAAQAASNIRIQP